MSNVLVLKRSAVAGKIPTLSQLSAGELAANTADQVMYLGTGTAVVKIFAPVKRVETTIDYAVTGAEDIIFVSPAANTTVVISLCAFAALNNKTGILIIKNIGSGTVSIVPHGTELLEGANAAFSLNGATAGVLHESMSLSPSSMGWWII